MKYLDYLTDNTLLVVPNDIKEDIILEVIEEKPLVNIKYSSLENLRRSFFEYDEKAVYYLMKHYNLKYEVALIYLDNMLYLKKKSYDNEKLNNLLKLKVEVKNLIKTRKINFDNIVVYGYDLSNFDLELLKDKKITMVKDKGSYIHNCVYEFKTINEEVEFVFDKIAELIKQGIDINKIKLMGVTNSYYSILKRMGYFYNIPISIPNDINLYQTTIGKYFIDNLSDTVIDEIKEKFTNQDIINKVIDIYNKYIEYDINDIKDLIIYDLKQTKIKNKELKNSVKLISFDSKVSDDDYVFILGFNYGSIPVIYKDEDFFNDEEKKLLGLFTSQELNKLEKMKIIDKINSIKNLYITYKLQDNKEKYLISNLNEELNLKIIKDYKSSFNHSDLYNQIVLSNSLDKLIKYGVKDENLVYLNNYDLNYRKYDNKYNKIENEDLLKYLNDNLLLSYSSIDNYYKCSFRYYLNNILKVNKFEETYQTVLGSLFHYVLSKAFTDDFDFEKEYQTFLDNQKYQFNNKEIFFIEKLKNELKFIIDTIKKQYQNLNLNQALYEQKIFIDKSTSIKVTFMGIIDKILYKEEDNQTILCIIDYKTGNPILDIDNTKYGLEMQLPIYLYLSKELKFKNIKIAGFYLQKILNNEINKDNNHSYLELKENNLKLQGYTNEDLNILEKFDKTYENSQVIKSLKTTSNGFSHYSKMINDEEIGKLIETVDEKINFARDNILNGSFDINPKRLDGENIGCLYCPFIDICYYQEKDIVDIGGDDNASVD